MFIKKKSFIQLQMRMGPLLFLFKTKWVRLSLPSEHHYGDEEEERLFRPLVSFSKKNGPYPHGYTVQVDREVQLY